MHLPRELRRNVIGCHGDLGRRWLDEMPALLRSCASRFGLTVLPPFERQTYNFVAPARLHDGSPVVLKCGVPGPGIRREIALLRLYRERPSVRVLDSDEDMGVVLLERIVPGRSLVEWASDTDDPRATVTAARVMRELRLDPTDAPECETVAEWLHVFDRVRLFPAWNEIEPLVADAQAVAQELLACAEERMLLHGDLHHDNILLDDERGWLAIDPMGVVAEPAVEIAVFVRNLWQDVHPTSDPRAKMTRRLDRFSEVLELDRMRAQGWSFVLAVVSAAWTVEEGGPDWRESLQVAQILRDI